MSDDTEVSLLFAINYRWRPGITADEARRIRQMFIAWNPPEGCEIVSHYHYAHGGSGIVIVRADSVASIFEATATFAPAVEFDTEPVLNVLEAIAIKMDVDDWAQSLYEAETKGGGEE